MIDTFAKVDSPHLKKTLRIHTIHKNDLADNKKGDCRQKATSL